MDSLSPHSRSCVHLDAHGCDFGTEAVSVVGALEGRRESRGTIGLSLKFRDLMYGLNRCTQDTGIQSARKSKLIYWRTAWSNLSNSHRGYFLVSFDIELDERHKRFSEGGPESPWVLRLSLTGEGVYLSGPCRVLHSLPISIERRLKFEGRGESVGERMMAATGRARRA